MSSRLSNPIIAISNPRIRCCVIRPRLGLISALSGFDNGRYSYQTLLCYSLHISCCLLVGLRDALVDGFSLPQDPNDKLRLISGQSTLSLFSFERRSQSTNCLFPEKCFGGRPKVLRTDSAAWKKKIGVIRRFCDSAFRSYHRAARATLRQHAAKATLQQHVVTLHVAHCGAAAIPPQYALAEHRHFKLTIAVAIAVAVATLRWPGRWHPTP